MGGPSGGCSYRWVDLVEDAARYTNGSSTCMSTQEHLGALGLVPQLSIATIHVYTFLIEVKSSHRVRGIYLCGVVMELNVGLCRVAGVR